jgi:hypothetical protein
MHRLRTCAVVLLIVSLLLLSSCSSLDAVANFATQSSQALAQGPAIFNDIGASCIRAQLIQGKSDADAATACAEFTDQTPAMLAASKTLVDYFTAISQLASTGKTASSKQKSADDQKAATKAAAKAPASGTLMKSVGSIITLIGKLAAEGYRVEHLQKDLNSVSGDVDAVLDALGKIGDQDYSRVLAIEQQVYNRQFEDLGLLPAGDPSTKIIRVLVVDNESKEARLLAAKQAAAKAYGEAIQKIKDGHNKLLQHPGKLDAKDVPALIQPYTDDLSQIGKSLLTLF